MKNTYRYEVSTTYILRSRSKCSRVMDHYRNVVIAESPEQAEEMVLKREAHPQVIKLIIGGIINLDVAVSWSPRAEETKAHFYNSKN